MSQLIQEKAHLQVSDSVLNVQRFCTFNKQFSVNCVRTFPISIQYQMQSQFKVVLGAVGFLVVLRDPT